MEKSRSDAGGWIPVLGNKRKLDAKVGYENLNRGEKGDAQWVTLFIDNLPEVTSRAWLKNFFTKFGIVRDVFIPEKRSKATGRRFGFVRYNCAVSADVAISKANGLWMEDRKLFVKIASFDQNDKERNVRLNKGPSKVVFGMESPKKDPGLSGNSNIPIAEYSKGGELVGGNFSYAQMLKGNNQGGLENDVKSGTGLGHCEQATIRVSLKPEGNGWLYRSAVAKLNRLISINELKVQMAGMGLDNIDVKAMGGRSMILTCPNREDMEKMVNEKCLLRWFSKIKPWDGEAACVERFVWLCCYGFPLNGWSNSSFKAIGELWGSFMCTDEPTLKMSSFAVAKILIATSTFKEIDEWVTVEVKGKQYKVKVMEDPCDQPHEAEKQIPRTSPHDSLNSEEESKEEEVIKEDEVVSPASVRKDNESSSEGEQNSIRGSCDLDNGRLVGNDSTTGGANTDGDNLGVAESGSSKLSSGSEELTSQLGGSQANEGGLIPFVDSAAAIFDSQNLLKVSQVEGLNLIVDLNQKEGSWGCTTQSFEEYRQKRDEKRSSSEAIVKLKRGVRRSERKIKKKKHLAEIEAKLDKLNHRKKKGPYSSMLFKEARKTLDMGAKLGIVFKGGRNYNLKRFVEMQEEELKERIHALDDYEEESISGDDDELEDGASLSLAF